MEQQKEQEARAAQTGQEVSMMNFKTDVESIMFHNYFVPNNIFEGRSFGGGDPRQFKVCKKCPPVKETTVD